MQQPTAHRVPLAAARPTWRAPPTSRRPSRCGPTASRRQLRDLTQWVCWRWEKRRNKRTGENKWTKPPIDPETGKHADVASGKRTVWHPFAVALAYYQANRDRVDGIGFVLAPDLGRCVIDLDDCRDPDTGAIDPQAQATVSRLNSYAEVSPSLTGLKIMVEGFLPPGGKRKGLVEMYDRARYLTLTGHRLDGTPATVEARQEELLQLHAETFRRPDLGKNGNGKAHARGPGQDPDPDARLIAKAMAAQNGGKFTSLWAGELVLYDGDASAADQALCNLLAFWTGGDADRMDRLFRRSGLFRPKWDEPHYADGRTYGQGTIDKAMEDCREHSGDRSRANGYAGTPPEPPQDESCRQTGQGGKQPAAQIIRAYWQQHYQPTFRRGAAVYSAALGREVRSSELLGAPTSTLIDLLTKAKEAPRNEETGEVKRSQLPKFYRTWAPVAWGDLLTLLRDEGESGEIVEPAEEEFRRAMATALLKMEALGRINKATGETIVERRPILDWAHQFAKAGRWQSVRGFRIWSRLDGDPPVDLRVAVRVELFGQLHAGGSLARLAPRRFTELCMLYGIGGPCRVQGGDARAVELSEKYLAELLAEPEGETPAAQTDGLTDVGVAPRARARNCVRRRGQW